MSNKVLRMFVTLVQPFVSMILHLYVSIRGCFMANYMCTQYIVLPDKGLILNYSYHAL